VSKEALVQAVHTCTPIASLRFSSWVKLARRPWTCQPTVPAVGSGPHRCVWSNTTGRATRTAFMVPMVIWTLSVQSMRGWKRSHVPCVRMKMQLRSNYAVNISRQCTTIWHVSRVVVPAAVLNSNCRISTTVALHICQCCSAQCCRICVEFDCPMDNPSTVLCLITFDQLVGVNQIQPHHTHVHCANSDFHISPKRVVSYQVVSYSRY